MARKLIYNLLIVTALLLGSGADISLFAKNWEPIRTEQIPESKIIAHDGDFELRATRGCIVVVTGHTTSIKIYSILGQLVASDTLQAGTHRLNLSTHGVYIVKVGTLTCKVAI
jgi:hypothetical protein